MSRIETPVRLERVGGSCNCDPLFELFDTNNKRLLVVDDEDVANQLVAALNSQAPLNVEAVAVYLYDGTPPIRQIGADCEWAVMDDPDSGVMDRYKYGVVKKLTRLITEAIAEQGKK